MRRGVDAAEHRPPHTKTRQEYRRRDSNPRSAVQSRLSSPLDDPGSNRRCGWSRTTLAGLMRPALLRGSQRLGSGGVTCTRGLLVMSQASLLLLHPAERPPGVAPGSRGWHPRILLLNHGRETNSSEPSEGLAPSISSLPVRGPALWA